MKDQRQEPRNPMMIPVILQGDGIEDHEAAFTEDVSQQGMRLRTHSKIEVGARIRVAMNLPSRQLEGTGVVVRICDSESAFGKNTCALLFDRPMAAIA